MVSKNQLKLIKSLHQKKYRNAHGLFLVEGKKTVKELLNSNFNLFQIFTTEANIPLFKSENVLEISNSDLKKISSLQNPNGVLGVFKIPEPVPIDFSNWLVVLDDVRDPGNLGTIIRLCDWFGIKNIVCSIETVDCYNPKVLQATMGSITRVAICYKDLEKFLQESNLPVYGTFMEGNSIYKETYPKAGILIFGNEGKGISPRLNDLIKKRITIPQFGKTTTESLNVATATAIVLSAVIGNN